MLLAALASTLIVTACANGDDSGAAADSTEADPATTIDPMIEEVAGRYAHYDVVAYEGSGMKTLIISYGFTDLDVVDGELVSTESFCTSEHRSDQPIEVQLTDEATQAIRPEPVPVEVQVTDGTVHISRPETPTGIGVDLEDPANDPLPTDPGDPRIVDDDDDGNPGVTAHITAPGGNEGDLFLARREIFAYEVDLQQDDSLVGSVTDRSEQLVIGATNPMFMNAGQWEQVPDPSKSPIILVPVERDWDCGKLMAERDELFPPTPEVDW